MRHIRLIFLVILILVLQVTAADSLRLFGTRPDFVFLLAAFLALNAPIRMSLPAAWGIGMGRDLLSVSPLGSSALLYMVAAILLAAAREIFVRENPFVQVILVFTAAGAINFMYGVCILLRNGSVETGEIVVRCVIMAAYTALVAPVVFWVFRLIRRPIGIDV